MPNKWDERHPSASEAIDLLIRWGHSFNGVLSGPKGARRSSRVAMCVLCLGHVVVLRDVTSVGRGCPRHCEVGTGVGMKDSGCWMRLPSSIALSLPHLLCRGLSISCPPQAPGSEQLVSSWWYSFGRLQSLWEAESRCWKWVPGGPVLSLFSDPGRWEES